jgi:hypothetical protein
MSDLTAAYTAHLATLADVLEALRMVADAERENAARFERGDRLIANTTPEQLERLGYKTITAMHRDIGERTGDSKRALQYLEAVAAAFPAVVLPDGTDLRGLNIAWTTYRDAMEKTDDPIRWAIYAHDHSLSATDMLTAYTLAQGEPQTAERVVWPLKNVEARVIKVGRNVFYVEVEPGTDLSRIMQDRPGQLSFAQIAHDGAQEATS